ncbi:hypothetical protein V5O48_009444 [Marasmius crinis-equi]|uniref:Uncharacterized protein n=1 Tax=Marasmius crinis-equi TaxID=585013 RepID=A0ABR3FBT4_9AGAR
MNTAIFPSYLKGELSQSKAKRRRRKRHPPVYLFIPPFSTSTFWSFDPNGQVPILKDLCRYLGLPVRLQLISWEYSWEAPTFQRLHDYQVARGFDPATTDFAQHLGYPIFDVVDQPLPSRFEELDESETIETSLSNTHQNEARTESSPEPVDFSLGILFGNTQALDEPLPLDLSDISAKNLVASARADITETEDGVTVNTRTNIWSRLIPGFSWAAMEDSDIHSSVF